MAGYDWNALGAALGQKAGDAIGGYEEGETRMGKTLAQQAALMSTAMANKAKAEDINQRIQYRTPEATTRLAGALAGLTDKQASQVGNYSRSGSWGMNWEDLPQDQAGPPRATEASAPAWATPETLQRFNTARGAQLLNLGGTGDSNADQTAKAFANLLEQGRIDTALRGGNQGLNAFRAADAGKLYSSAPQGILSQETGTEAPNPAWVDVQRSAALENRAQAGNAAASAAANRARVGEIQAQTELHRSKIGQGQTMTLPDGTVVTTGPAMPKLTELQGKAMLFGSRAAEADRIITELEGKYSPAAVNAKQAAEGVWGIGGALGTAGNAMLSDSAQKAEQAQRDFVNAVLRLESGAAISDQEFANAKKQYFPQPNDSQAVLQQKANNRKLAIEGLRVMAGPAADRVHPSQGADVPQAPAPSGATTPVRPVTGVRYGEMRQPVSSAADKTEALRQAREAVQAGAPRDAVIKRLRELGINDGAL